METEELITEELDGDSVEQLRAESIAIVRDLILKGNPDLVPDLVRGETLAELMDSVEPARAAYRQIAEAVRAEVRTSAPIVPAGGAAPVAIEELTAGSLIKRGLEQARRIAH
jgi:hypothetical protein